MKRQLLLTPGPTPLPPAVSNALAHPFPHHRTPEFARLFDETLEGLRYVYRTRNTVLLMASSGTGAMESAVANLFSPDDKTLVCSTGIFGERFAKILTAYGVSASTVSAERGQAVSPKAVGAALRARPETKAVFLQHTDTSTAVRNDVEEIAAAVRREAPEALIVVDAVSALATERLETDLWGLDVVVSGSQKGLMNAPGLAFCAISPRAWKAAEKARLPRFYFDWRPMRDSLSSHETPFTPAAALIQAQAEALKMIRAKGIEKVWDDTAALARHCRERAAAEGLALFARDPADGLTALRLPAGTDGQALVEGISREDGISIAGGQGPLKGKIVRIAHMGYIQKADLEAGMTALAKRLHARV